MQRIVVRSFGGPDEMKLEEADTPNPGVGEVLVAVEAAGVNYLDVIQRIGMVPAPLPFTPGLEGVGRIVAVGADSQGLAVGQRIAWINAPGSYASEVLVPASEAISLPASLTKEQALLFQPITAQYLVSEYRDVKPGDRVLVHSAAGGVGQLLVQWLKHLGAWVVGTVSSDAKASAAKAAGADLVINYGPDCIFLDELLAATDGRGVDLVFDAVGASTFANSIKALARGGTVVCYGGGAGPPPSINPQQMMDACIRVAGGSLFSYTASPAELRQRAAAAIAAIEEGWLRLDQMTSYGLDQAVDAHRDIQGRGTQGKLYIKP